MNPKKDNPFSGMDAALAADTPRVRKRGLLRFLIGACGTAVVAGIFTWLLPQMNLQATPKGLMVAAIPGGFGLVGLMEVFTGIGYGEWARRWDSIKGWQRGVLGLFIVCLVLVLFGLATAIFMSPG